MYLFVLCVCIHLIISCDVLKRVIKIILQVIATQLSHIRNYRGPRDTTFWGYILTQKCACKTFPAGLCVIPPHTYVRRPLLRGANNELSKKKVKDELSSYALILFSSIGSVLKSFSNQVHEIIRSID